MGSWGLGFCLAGPEPVPFPRAEAKSEVRDVSTLSSMMIFFRWVHRDRVEQEAPVVYRQRPREERALDDHFTQVVLFLFVQLEPLEREAVLEIWSELEDVEIC